MHTARWYAALAFLVVVAVSGCDLFSPSPTRIGFISSPPASLVATDTQPPVQVAFLSDDGEIVEDVRDPITLAVVGGLSPAQTTGDLQVEAVSGVATFNVEVLTAATGYRLEATSTRFDDKAVSEPFDVLHGPATRVRIDPLPVSMPPGTPISVVARITDDAHNTVPSAIGTVTLTGEGVTLQGTTTRSTTAGVATFTNLFVCGSGAIVASAPGLTSGTSVTFSVTGGPAAKIVWTIQPSNGSAGVTLPQFALEVQDQCGKPVVAGVMSGWGTCSASLADNPSGATLPWPFLLSSSASVRNGDSRFVVDRAGSGYTFLVTCRQHANPDNVLTSAPSAPFNVVP